MRLAFKDNIKKHFPELSGKRIGVAFSGGIDSVCLAHLMHSCGYQLVLLHCNFMLRQDESDQDQLFSEEFAASINAQFLSEQFNVKELCKKTGASTQMVAREVRYKWFRALIKDKLVDFVLTAHHANDSLETLLINLSRGSGLAGLTGIPAKNGGVLRPLLAFSRLEIEAYINKHQLSWREDSSNASDAYLRNAIRHKVIPELKAISPQFLAQSSKSQQHLSQAKIMLNAFLEEQKLKCLTAMANEGERLNIQLLNNQPSAQGFLFYWLQPYGFTAWDDIYTLAYAQTGKQIESPSHTLTKDRDALLLTKKSEENEEVFWIQKEDDSINTPLKLTIESVKGIEALDNTQIIVDADLLEFPLELRNWRNGDRFYPLGMKGSKKVSDYFTNLKLSRPEKEKIWLLCSGKKIVWIVGYRADDRFKVSSQTKNFLKFTQTP